MQSTFLFISCKLERILTISSLDRVELLTIILVLRYGCYIVLFIAIEDTHKPTSQLLKVFILMTFQAVQGRSQVENPIQKRLKLEERERRLHEQLAEDTRRLQNARAQVKLFEDAMEQTIKELHEVRHQRNELTELIEGVWNGPAASRSKSPNG